MAIKELLKIVPPPKKPLEVGKAASWKKLEATLGLTLPSDLRDFGMHYGSGRFCGGFLLIYNPFATYYLKAIESDCSILLALQHMSVEEARNPYPVYPNYPGLLPIGSDENGGTLCWLTKGTPDKWPIIIKSHEDEYKECRLTLTTFLAKAMSNKIKVFMWDRFKAEERCFEPRLN